MTWRKSLAEAQTQAAHGRFGELLNSCQALIHAHFHDADALLGIGGLLQAFGYLSLARACFRQACILAPRDLRPHVSLANLALEAGNHGTARHLYAELLRKLPDNALVRRNAVLTLEYDPEVSDVERLARAREWGAWATMRAGGPHPRPSLSPLVGRPLRIGYVSADFCQHTVGLFAKDVLVAHDPAWVTVHVYSAGRVDDWVTAAIREASIFRDVSGLDDGALAKLIREDRIDVLVDLSGHTAGSRLTAFAHRPAPVQVSWLGYFATTGLPAMDAVLLDDWHAPPGAEASFTERVIRLPSGRLCYTPVPWAPLVSPPPSVARGQVTFGCFNNTAKLNSDVLALWARLLIAVPDARLVLKWRTFQDDELCSVIRHALAALGIAPDRVELRGASFHADLLQEYADIDIALDPFPFTGGLTSCEALWMGVPVVTWPQTRVVSRQTFALLSAIGLPELAATDAEDYIRIASHLAAAPKLRGDLRRTLRQRMATSPLSDVRGFTRGLEEALIGLAQAVV